MVNNEMIARIEQIEKEALEVLSAAQDNQSIENIRIECLGKKGSLTKILKSLKELSPDEKKIVGKHVNIAKSKLETLLKEKKTAFDTQTGNIKDFIDYTLPGKRVELGRRHPIMQTIEEICQIFKEIGFQVVDGREIETERYNFTILNIPLDHPARDAFDTFYTEDGALLRSQTSTAQGRIMEKISPPLAVISYGKVYRPDTVDATHSFMFHQMEGFLVDTNVTFSDLKGVLHLFAKKFFGKDTNIRFRPHFFPFTEPSVEVDITCFACHGSGCPVCSRSGWIEILGAGSIDPAVFEQVGYESGKYKGFAFGLGIERICMLRSNIHDIRYFYENNISFLKQF
ncbi:phenylalanine--tRNA ligase subunit alpha [Candidatus Omnitrophota bacterium]